MGKKIQSVIKNLPKHNKLEPDGFTGEFNQSCKEESPPIFLKIFSKI